MGKDLQEGNAFVQGQISKLQAKKWSGTKKIRTSKNLLTRYPTCKKKLGQMQRLRTNNGGVVKGSANVGGLDHLQA